MIDLGVVLKGIRVKGVLYKKSVVDIGVVQQGVVQKWSCENGVAPRDTYDILKNIPHYPRLHV
jgi:hypothetical protein